MFKVVTAALMIICLLILSPVFAGAGLQDEIDEMFRRFGFKAHGTEAGAYMMIFIHT